MPLENLVVQITDPGAIGAGELWSNPSTEPPVVKVRNKANTGWDSVGGSPVLPATTVTGPDAFGASAVVGTGALYARNDHDHGLPAAPTVPTGGTPALVLSTAAAAGVSPNFIRDDDTIVAFDTTVPVTQAYNDVAATGAATVSARRDHKHGMPASGGASGGTPALTLGTANTAGVAGTFIRDDDTILAFDATVPVTQALGDAAATGAATVTARRDHKHGMPAFATNAIALGTAAAAGAATTPMRSNDTILAFDATVPVTQAFGDAAATGAATVTARRDHKHGMPANPTPAFATPTIALGTAAAAGAATTVIRSDSTILAFDATVPTTIASGASAATGAATVAARRDHTHGAPTLAVAPTETEAFLGADVTIVSANTFVDGPTITPVAGTYMVWAGVTVSAAALNSAAAVTAKLWDGTTVLADGENSVPGTAASGEQAGQIALTGMYVANGSTALKVSVAATIGSSTYKIKTTCADNGSANKASWIKLLKIA